MNTKLYRGGLVMIAALLLLAPTAPAFPPAPHHLLYGMVRDELGNPIAGENADLIFENAGGASMTTRILYKGIPGQNYTLEVPMDSGITADAYMPTALRPTAPFRIRVRIANTTYLPIEMSGDYASLGLPGRKTRLNLTLGVDSDGDGLPDAWERNLIAALRLNAALAELSPSADSDGDGMSNLDEYLAGTYAFDSEDGFALKIKAMNGPRATLEFMAIRGRNYTIHASADLITWTPAPFRANAADPASPLIMEWFAEDVRIVEVEAEPEPGAEPARFFKLRID